MEKVREALGVSEDLVRLLQELDLEAVQLLFQARNIRAGLERVLKLCEWSKSCCAVTKKPHGDQEWKTLVEKDDVFRKCPFCGSMAPALDVGCF